MVNHSDMISNGCHQLEPEPPKVRSQSLAGNEVKELSGAGGNWRVIDEADRLFKNAQENPATGLSLWSRSERSRDLPGPELR